MNFTRRRVIIREFFEAIALAGSPWTPPQTPFRKSVFFIESPVYNGVHLILSNNTRKFYPIRPDDLSYQLFYNTHPDPETAPCSQKTAAQISYQYHSCRRQVSRFIDLISPESELCWISD